eukprot:Skav204511  [mRNA]  locus=scaffold4122:28359:42217:- [translate_table: standard]
MKDGGLKDIGLKDGGWKCPSCEEKSIYLWNYDWRKVCVRCGTERPDRSNADNDGEHAEEEEEQSDDMDWQKEADTPADADADWKVKDERPWDENEWHEEEWKQQDDSAPQERSHDRSPEAAPAGRSHRRSLDGPRWLRGNASHGPEEKAASAASNKRGRAIGTARSAVN